MGCLTCPAQKTMRDRRRAEMYFEQVRWEGRSEFLSLNERHVDLSTSCEDRFVSIMIFNAIHDRVYDS